MSLTTFLTNKKAAFAELRKQGLDLLATPAGRHLLGHLILRQGSFSQDQRQRLKVVTNGSIDFREIEMAIQKVFGDRLDELSQDHGAPHRRWRSATYWGDNEDGEIEDEDWDYDVFESELMDPFEDLICMNENEEAQMVFQDELPVIMDEADALEAVSNQIEEIYYEAHNRMQSKGKGFKGKGKKGKSKSPTRTYGQGAPSFGSGKGGGYLEHRRLLQASRNGRGYDRPWTRTGSRMSLNDLKAKTRCHTCKQVGHWSKECPHRAKTTSPTSRSSSSTGAMSTGMSTGFFIQPPAKLAGAFLTTTNELETKSEYIAAEFTGLSFVFLAVHEDQGTALVDTAAQHGLVGRETLEQHDTLLQERFGLRVQWSHEAGGSVRGVCGKEESTSIAYVPIGLGGKSGVLRVQVVPGTIPFLIPAYFLSNVGAVIDMEHAVIWYTKLATSQNMRRLSSGHVSVSIIDFGKSGSNVPSNFAASSSQAWSVEPIPDWATLDALSHYPAAMVPLAALVAAISTIGLPSSLASAPGSCANTPTSRSPLATTATRAFGATSLPIGTGGTASSSRSSRHDTIGFDWIPGNGTTGGESPTTSNGERKGQIPGPCLGTFTGLHSPGSRSETWSQSSSLMAGVQSVPAEADHAIDSDHRTAQLEPEPGLHPGRLLRRQEEVHQEQERFERCLQPTPKSSSRAMAYKSKARPPMVKQEIKQDLDEIREDQNSWCDVVADDLLKMGQTAAMIGDQDVAMVEIQRQAHSQSCDVCHTGMVTLCRHVPSMNLLWKCDNMRCDHHWGDLNDHVQPAYGTMICPRCNSKEMLVIKDSPNPEDVEIQCMEEQCGLAAFLFEMPVAYARMGRFNINLLHND